MKLKVGIIGLGAQGRKYALALNNGLVNNIELCAVYNRSSAGIQWAQQMLNPSVICCDDVEYMLRLPQLDAVVICVPHYQHCEFAIRALHSGLHVLCEKPAGVYVDTVREMNEAARQSGSVYSIMWNLRAVPMYRTLKQLMEDRVLGELSRITWITTDWYRTQAYYDSCDWRATWAGEGGGILANQCAHNLDMLQWLFGMPETVKAYCKYGVHRRLDVENEATAILEYPNGATCVFITSAHEICGTNRLEINGENGKIIAENGEILLYTSTVGEREFNESNTSIFAQPEVYVKEIYLEQRAREPWVILLENFADAVLKKTPLISPGEEGVYEAMLCSAMQLSDWSGEPIMLKNLDTERHKYLLGERIKMEGRNGVDAAHQATDQSDMMQFKQRAQ